MSDLKTILERGVGGFEPLAGGLDRTQERRRRHHRNRKVGSAIVALVVAAAGISFVVVSLGGARHTPPGPAGVTTPLPSNGEIWVRVGGGDGPSFVYQVDPSTGNVTPLWHDQSGSPLPGRLNRSAIGEQYAWSPDGSQVAFSDYSGAHEQTAIYLMDPSGLKRTQLTSGEGMASFPAWSPHGSKIAYASDTGPPPSGSAPFYEPGCEYSLTMCPSVIAVIGTDGSGFTQLTRTTGTMPAWSPDGSKIAFVGQVGGGTQIFVMNADGSDVAQLTSGAPATQPEWSPDGSEITFLRTGTPYPGPVTSGGRSGSGPGSSELFVMKPDGSDVRQLTHTGSDVGGYAWSPDGTEIALDTGGDLGTLSVISSDGAPLNTIPVAPRYGMGDIAWRPTPHASAGPTTSYRDPEGRWSFRYPASWHIRPFQYDCGHLTVQGVMVSNVPLTPSQPVVRQTSISCTFRPVLAAAPGGTVAVEILDLFGGPGPVFPRPHHITYPLSLDGAQPFSLHEPSGVTFTMREIGVPPVPDHTSVQSYLGSGSTLGDERATRRIVASIRFPTAH